MTRPLRNTTGSRRINECAPAHGVVVGQPQAAAGASAASLSKLVGVSSVPFGETSAFQFRTEPCPHCDTAVQSGCPDCVRGEVDAACADCGNVYPLNADGLCEPCALASELTTAEWIARFRPHLLGWSRVEL